MKSVSAVSLLALTTSQPFVIEAFVPRTATSTYLSKHAPSIPTAFAPLNMAAQVEESESPYVNFGLVAQQAANQALIGSSIWNGGDSYQVLAHQAHIDPSGLALGLLGLIPLLVFSNKVETSESPLVAGLNLSTNALMLRMFGDVSQPQLAFGVSAFLAGLTGLVEETIFRGQLLPVLAQWSTDHIGLVGGSSLAAGVALSTIVFAALHANPTSLFRGKGAIQENLGLFAFQMVTGGIFASLYVATGNLAVPIVAHALYDFVTLYKTHLDVTGQIQYASTEELMPSTSSGGERKWEEERGEEFVQKARKTFYLMDRNQDGVLSRQELRVALYSFGITLSMSESETITETADLDASGEIDFGEFLEFIGPQGSPEKAVRYAVLGSA